MSEKQLQLRRFTCGGKSQVALFDGEQLVAGQKAVTATWSAVGDSLSEVTVTFYCDSRLGGAVQDHISDPPIEL